MCVGCPHADTGTGAYASGVVGCTISGRSIVERYEGAVCPMDRVREDGTTLWAGLVWMGVPWPVRVWLWIFHPSRPRISSFAGCGCVRVFKDFYRSFVNGNARHNPGPG